MHTSSSVLALTGLAATAAAETIHGVVVFSRHGDRTTKHFGSQVLTALGAQQVFQVGSDYRSRYLSSDSPHRIHNISEFEYVPAQVYASAPDSPILLNTATSFLQGLYPPLGDIQPSLESQSLANGTNVTTPLTGYQYVTLHGIDADSPSTIWIKGDDSCPAISTLSSTFTASAEYHSLLSSTQDFYRSLYPLVHEIYPSADALSYAKAYDIFDVINVENLHNASSPARNVTPDQLFQLRTLADSSEFGLNFNASQPSRSIHAATFAGAVLSHLNETVHSAGQNPKFTLLAGSYDTFLAFFGLANLTAVSTDFYGLPDYASTMAFELFTPDEAFDESAVRVRFQFRNGTEGELTNFPLFASGKADLAWSEFVEAMQERGIETAQEWCGRCQSEAVFCAAYGTDSGVDVSSAGESGDSVSRGSWIAVLVVMAVAIAGNLAWAAMWFSKSRQAKGQQAAAAVVAAKGSDSVRSYDGKESV